MTGADDHLDLDLTTRAVRLGMRLREARNAAGLTLAALESESGGKWKAVVVGSYERADRHPTWVRVEHLAAYYGIDPAALLGTGDLRPRQDVVDRLKARLTAAVSEAVDQAVTHA